MSHGVMAQRTSRSMPSSTPRRRTVRRSDSFFLPMFPSLTFRSCLLLVGIFATATVCSATAGSVNGNRNAYQILGLSGDCTQEDVQKRYRRLCLKYHPDKNTQLDGKARARCEEEFKLVQSAYSQIGDEGRRRRYDFALRSPSSSPLSHPRHRAGDADIDEWFRTFYGQHQRRYYGPPQGPRTSGGAASRRPRSRPPRPFFVNGTPFYWSGFGAGGSGGGGGLRPPSFGLDVAGSARSVYVQEVTVPLNVLYSGSAAGVAGRGRSHRFVLRDTAWRRHLAAVRGGAWRNVAIRCLLSSLPVLVRLRRRPLLSLGLLLGYVHWSLPRPTKLVYEATIRPGWKGGTRLRYDGGSAVGGDRHGDEYPNRRRRQHGGSGAAEPGFVVVFVLREGRHDRFVRRGNDLETTVTVSSADAERGCEVMVRPLGRNEVPIFVRLKAGEVMNCTGGEEETEDDVLSDGLRRRRLVVKGRGWPAKGGGRGDLVINVEVAPPTGWGKDGSRDGNSTWLGKRAWRRWTAA